jgi:hypothetical protein
MAEIGRKGGGARGAKRRAQAEQPLEGGEGGVMERSGESHELVTPSGAEEQE